MGSKVTRWAGNATLGLCLFHKVLCHRSSLSKVYAHISDGLAQVWDKIGLQHHGSPTTIDVIKNPRSKRPHMLFSGSYYMLSED